MFRILANLHIVLAVWFIIVGGIIIFIDGDRGCIACNGMISTVVGVINILIGAIGIIGKFSSNPMPG
jgi:hypothetical protein